MRRGSACGAIPAEAARWYKLAAANGDRQAIFALGIAKLNGEGVPKDRAGAAELFEKAAAQNHPGALYNLGILAIENNGVTTDFPQAARLLGKQRNLAIPRPPMRWACFTGMAPASKKATSRPRFGLAGPRGTIMFRRKSNMRSCFSTE